MAQNLNRLAGIVAILAMAAAFVSCDKNEDYFNLNMEGGLHGSSSDLQIQVSRDAENGVIEASREINGIRQDTLIVLPLGGVDFQINPADTILVSKAEARRSSFTKVNEDVKEYEENGVYYTATSISYNDEIEAGGEKYTKEISISFLDAYVYVWGEKIEFPAANGEVVIKGEPEVTATGKEGNFNYFMSTSSYDVFFMDNANEEKGEKGLKIDATDVLTSTVVAEFGLDYIDRNTFKSWVEIKETWSSGREENYIKSQNVIHSIAVPERISRELPDFNLVSGAPVEGTERLVSSIVDGDFTVETYEKTYTVSNDKFSRTFTLTYQKAIYNPLSYKMPSAVYENLQDNGFNLTDMPATRSGYSYKNYAHNMSAMIAGYPASATAEAELFVKAEEPEQPENPDRETPSWLGAPKGAKYTRVQRTVGAQFEDMIVFQYEHGVVMAPNGVVDMNLIYAFDANVASANGVDVCIAGAYSGVFGNGKWQPATITEVSGRWIYAGVNSSWDHTVMETNAITLGIGVDVDHTPKAQSTKIDGNQITIRYAVNNGRTTADSSLSLR